MQARKLSLAEAHPSQVVRIEVDVTSQCIAILLRNSSCLLFPSFTASSSSPSLIVPSCTDICFLRLRQRCAHLSSSSSSDKSAEAGSEPKKLADAKGKPGAQRIGDALPRVASMGNAEAGFINEVLLFLALKPAKGGVSTDLLAWRRTGIDFLQTPIFLDGSPNGCNGSLVARLYDISHGISVGIAASINVVTVHSPANGKLWLFSAKQGSTKSHGLDPSHTQKDLMLNIASQYAFDLERDKHEREKNSCLQLLKCAVVDCNGPVYAMHLSLQHLLVGQLGGVRVWLLRPLIKGSEVAKRDLKAAVNCGKCIGVKQEKMRTPEEEDFERKSGESFKGINGQLAASVEGSVSLSTLKSACTLPAALKNGLYDLALHQSVGTSNVCMNGYSSMGGNFTNRKQGWGCNGRELSTCSHYCTKLSTSLDMQQEALSALTKPAQLETATMPHYRNGTFLDFDGEEHKSQQRLSQFSMFSSSSDSSSSLPHPLNTCTRSASCQSLTSSLSSIAGAPGTRSALHKSEFRKGTPSGVFIPLQKGQPTSSAKAEQVTSIHGLSEKDFLVLDSNGKLHVLTLQYVTRKVERKVEASVHQPPRVALSASLQHLSCGIRIKYLAVLSDVHNSTKNPGYALRKLWVSDGSHTLYIVTIPPKEPSEEESGKARAISKNNLTVIRTIFLMERAYSISAVHENAVLVLTEGSMLEYSGGS